jgi:hypothetical protein
MMSLSLRTEVAQSWVCVFVTARKLIQQTIPI